MMLLLIPLLLSPSFALEKKSCGGQCTSLVEVRPEIKKAEVKLTLPCSAEAKLPLIKKENELIEFYEPANPEGLYPLNDQGIIIRSRNSPETDSFDVTVKYRPKSGDLLIEEESYSKLKAYNDADATSASVEFKCEADVSYAQPTHNLVESCSLTTASTELTPEHLQFVAAFPKKLSPLPFNLLAAYRKFSIESTSWKLDIPASNQKISDQGSQFKSKKISIEKWIVGESCFLEASSKVNVAQINEAMNELAKGFKALGFDPDQIEQGQKTSKAFKAAPKDWSRLIPSR